MQFKKVGEKVAFYYYQHEEYTAAASLKHPGTRVMPSSTVEEKDVFKDLTYSKDSCLCPNKRVK